MISNEDLDYEVLELFYKVLRKSAVDKLNKKDPLFFQFMEITSGNRTELIRNSAVNIVYEPISAESIEKLIEKKFIMKMECNTCYALTAKGIFSVEEHLNLIDLTKLLDLIQVKYFTILNENVKLTDTEKTVILALLSSRSFSIEACMNMDSLRTEEDSWLRIFKRSALLLKEMGVINSIPKKLNETEGSAELALAYIMRRLNNLQEKTKNLYRFNKKSCFYLDLKRNGEISVQDMTKLFRKVFDQTLTTNELEKINQFIAMIASEEIIQMSWHEGRIYCNPKMNLMMEEALNNVVLSKD